MITTPTVIGLFLDSADFSSHGVGLWAWLAVGNWAWLASNFIVDLAFLAKVWILVWSKLVNSDSLRDFRALGV